LIFLPYDVGEFKKVSATEGLEVCKIKPFCQHFGPSARNSLLITGLDHGVGHSLLLLYDVKAPNGQKSKEFKGLRHYPSNTSLSLF
jgi:hypothetical protein